MSDFDELSKKLDSLNGTLGKSNYLAFVKDVLIPIATLLLLAMGYVANNDANQRQQKEAEAARQQKYLEYFLTNYSDTSSTKQAASFALLKYVEPKVRNELVFDLSANTQLSKEAWRVLSNMDGISLNFGEANDYGVDIYFAKEHEQVAQRIKSQLKSVGFNGLIKAEEKNPAFWDQNGWPNGAEIRFEPTQDSAATEYLFRFLDTKNPTLRLLKRAVDDRSRPNSVAIHLPPNQRPSRSRIGEAIMQERSNSAFQGTLRDKAAQRP